MTHSTFDVVVAGAGIGGMCAAISAARLGASVLLIETCETVGGTGVHSPVTLIGNYFDASKRIINAGLLREFFPHFYNVDLTRDQVLTYDERDLAARYQKAIEDTPNLTVWCGTTVVSAATSAGQPSRITSVTTRGQHLATVRAKVFIDSTADGNLSALAGAEFAFGRESDGRTQPATLTFKVVDIDMAAFRRPLPNGRITGWAELDAVRAEMTEIYLRAKRDGRLAGMPREDVLCFPYPTEPRSLLFNQTRILGVDPTDSNSMAAAMAEGQRQAHAFFNLMKAEHPAFAHARIEFISPKLGVREGRRIIGDYILTAEDCLGQARFNDMVAACGYAIDIHNPDGEGSTIRPIPGSGYYHIPYRCLCARGFANLLLGSRCISGTHEAHSSYRVMPPLGSIGQAAGSAAALSVLLNKSDVRAVTAAQIRCVLREAGEFVEGLCEATPEPVQHSMRQL